MTYHVLLDGEQQGPFERDVLAGMVARGEINAETLVWSAGMADWVPAATVDELSALLAGATLGAPPAPQGERRRLAVGRALGDGLRVIARQPLRLIGVIVFYAVVGFVATAPIFALMFIGALSGANGEGYDAISGVIGWLAVGYLVTLVVTTALYGGVCAVMLDAVRGMPIRFAHLFAGCKRIIPLFLFMLIVLLISGMALVPMGAVMNDLIGAWALLAFLPVIFLAVALILGPFYIIDGGAGPVQAVTSSFRTVMRFGWFHVFGALLVLAILSVALLIVVGLVMGLATMVAFGVSTDGGSDAIIAAQSIVSMVPQLFITYGLLVVWVGVFAAIYEQARAG